MVEGRMETGWKEGVWVEGWMDGINGGTVDRSHGGRSPHRCDGSDACQRGRRLVHSVLAGDAAYDAPGGPPAQIAAPGGDIEAHQQPGRRRGRPPRPLPNCAAPPLGAGWHMAA